MAVDPHWEREFNPRLSVPDAPALYADWPVRAAGTRARRPPETVAYGTHPREAIDIFRAPDARGALLFFHGGYWRAFSKEDFSWVADGFVDQGLTVAVAGYPLCPDVTLARLCESARAAAEALWRDHLSPSERARFVVSGHSAGGYLTALMLATDWTARGLPVSPFAAALSVSGVFDLTHFVETSMNEVVGLSPSDAAALSLTTSAVRAPCRLVLAVGAEESAEFHRQSEGLARAWADLAPEVVDLAGRNHFTILEDLVSPGGPLNRRVTAAP
ncbi:alpha/beta hydrolase [Prosthecomicrobium sp. N25]|uniref:alpha/beta hydrolase n=1 Tax=Prosthecomicrobium sp. N25 TaxID=3129254 RepID=UPI0030779E61